jgi:hypothetical protein
MELQVHTKLPMDADVLSAVRRWLNERYEHEVEAAAEVGRKYLGATMQFVAFDLDATSSLFRYAVSTPNSTLFLSDPTKPASEAALKSREGWHHSTPQES